MIIFGILLVPIVLLIIMELNKLNTGKIKKRLLNIFLIGISFIYLVLSLSLKIEPFDFEITLVGDYFIYAAVVFVFSPFLWVVLYYYCKKLFRNIRVHKNAKIKSNKDYLYYRDDLNKISPSIVMFTSIMDTDIKKAVSATILKLKLTGYLKEVSDKLRCTNKDDAELLESEKIILQSVKSNSLDEKMYKRCVEKEAIKYKYIKRNSGGKLLRIVKMLIIGFIPVILIISSMKFDDYVFNDYEIYVLDDVRYLKITSEKEIDNLYNNEVKDINDYYHRYITYDDEERLSYSYSLIRADRLQYRVVRFKFLLDILDPLFILASIVSIFVALFMIIEQIIYFNKSYRRTIKGTEILNKAYALKNYLKDFSNINKRVKGELVLWEYYLVYAVILDVNVKIKNEIIESYLK